MLLPFNVIPWRALTHHYTGEICMKRIITVAAAAIVLSTSAFAAKVQVNVNMKAVSQFKQTSDMEFTKLFANISGNAQVKISDGFRILADVNQPINKRENATGLKRITVLDKKLINILDNETNDDGSVNNINDAVSARVKIKRGEVRSIKVKSADIEGLYQEIFEKAGINILRNLQIQEDGVTLTSKIGIGDMNCEKERGSQILTCEQDISMNITAQD